MFKGFQISARVQFMLLAVCAFVLLVPGAVPVDAADCGPNNICFVGVYHDSRDPQYRTPTGAAPINESVTLRLETVANDVQWVDLRVYNTQNASETFTPMSKVASFDDRDFWEVEIATGGEPNILYYWFRLTDGSDVDYYEDDRENSAYNQTLWGGPGTMQDNSSDASWALTVYDPSFTTPDWVKNGIMYQIFPDRFRDGDPSNNNLAGEFFYNEAGGTIVRSGTVDWNTVVCDPRDPTLTGNNCTGSWSRNFYGGDLAGITEQLDYLQGLGVSVIYMTPVFESPSNHKYDARDYSIVDDNFGGDAALATLITEAHSRGMYVVLDGVFNHVSSDSPYFDRYARYPTVGACEDVASPYVDMFDFFPYAGTPPAPCSDNRDYNKWFGFDSLAVLDSAGAFARDAVWDNGIVHPSGKNVAVGPYWVAQGADGWRLDVANDVDPEGMFGANDYWENFRDAIKAANPNAYIVGEFWGLGTSWISGGVADRYVPAGSNPGEWDANMNYQQFSALLSLWRDTPLTENDFNSGSLPGAVVPMGMADFVERYLNLKERYAPEAFYALMNLNGSHDTNRVLFLLDEGIPATPAELDQYPIDPAHYLSGAGVDAINRLKGLSLMQYTLPGAPQIYYGTEVGLVQPTTYAGGKWEDDPYNRVPFPWQDANHTGTPYFDHLQVGSPVRADLTAYFTQLGSIRNSVEALRTGDVIFLLNDDGAKTLGYLRINDAKTSAAVVLVNRDSTAKALTVDVSGYLPEGATFEDALSLATATVTGGELTLTVPANGGAILLPQVPLSGEPGVPTGLSATPVSGTQVDLAWTASPGAASYRVLRSYVSGGGYVEVGTTASTTYPDTTVSPGTKYFYVVVAIDAGGVDSDHSNEASATPFFDLSGAYLNVQWPPLLNYTLNTETTTDTVYGQYYIGGVTDTNPDCVPGVIAQLGFGTGDPITDDWTWSPMAPNAPTCAGSNDEVQGTMKPNAVGTFGYTTRYSSDAGATWYFAEDFPGGSPDCPVVNHGASDDTPVAVCTLNVAAGADVTDPTPPTLVKDHDTVGEVGLSWSGATDETAIGLYRIYRSGDGGGSYQQIAEVDDAVSSYEDTTVAAAQSYLYYVTAVDTSYNESTPSNTVDATAENTPVTIVINVQVPAFTPAGSVVQAIGSIAPLTNWGAGLDMASVGANEWEVEIVVPEATSFEYKHRRDASWDKVEKEPNGYDESPNRQYTVGYYEDGDVEPGKYQINGTVDNWRDVLVTGVVPADGATDVARSAAVDVTFNKTVAPSAQYTVTDEGASSVPGGFVRSVDELSVTFTPDDDLCPSETYTVDVAGVSAAGDGFQFTPFQSTFTTEAAASPVAVTFRTTVPTFTPVGSTVYLSGNTPLLGDNVIASAAAMTYNGIDGVWEVTVNLTECDEVTVFHSRGSAGTIETDGPTGFDPALHVVTVVDDGSGTQVVDLTVENWEDVIVTDVSPADDAAQVPVDTTVVVTLNKNIETLSTFAVVDQFTDAVAGAFSYNPVARQLTFTPDADLAFEVEFTVTVSGLVAVDGAVQVVPSVTTFITTPKTVAVTWALTVPTFTPPGSTIYIYGDVPELGSGSLNTVAMTQTGPSTYEFAASFLEGTSINYGFSRGSANTEATAADGETSSGGTVVVEAETGFEQTVDVTAGNWRDPIVLDFSPADLSTGNGVTTPISVLFSKPIGAASTFTVENSDAGAETGTFGVDGPGTTVTFTPTVDYRYADTITVTVAGIAGAATGTQEGSVSFSFKTDFLELLANADFEADPPTKLLDPWTIKNPTGDKLKCNSTGPRAVPTTSGLCAFLFKGRAAENAKLQQTVDLSGITFVVGDQLIFSTYVDNATGIIMFAKLKVKYVGGSKSTEALVLVPTVGYQRVTAPAITIASADVETVKVTFNHKATNGKTYIDDASVALRQGNARRAGASSDVLPAPNAPDAWRSN
ncbi:MAG: alpha amylase N-terminal ig-like domain-containing protein [Chloroflexi bacterium]|nr:alpha amylase N-terminal ig-like domain-containing protein [Chloroflexota bacterium]